MTLNAEVSFDAFKVWKEFGIFARRAMVDQARGRSAPFKVWKEFGIFARRAMVDQAREGLCYQ